MISPIRVAKNTFHGKVVGNVFSGYGLSGSHSDSGLYRFEGKLEPAHTIINVQVANPWALEETAVEVEICLAHSGSACPDATGDGEDDGANPCRRVKAVVPSPRWVPVVSDVSRDHFYVNIWRAPLAPDDGSAAVGETVRADVDFFIVGIEV